MVHEFEGRTEKEAIDKAVAELNLEKDTFDVEILESQRTRLFKKGFVRIRVHVNSDDGTSSDQRLKKLSPAKQLTKKNLPSTEISHEEIGVRLVNYLTELIQKMGYQAKVTAMFQEQNKIGLKIESEQSSILIGKKGKTLDALQLLVNVHLSKTTCTDLRVVLDSENYRIRREESLVRMAYNVADKVRETKSSILLEPMNPFERRLIHTTLSDINDISTKSEGDGIYKQVRVFYIGLKF